MPAVTEFSAPLLSEATITAERFEHEPVEALVFNVSLPAKSGWSARVEMGDRTAIFDIVDGESVWHLSGLWIGGLPVFFNGIGSRCTIGRAVLVLRTILLGIAFFGGLGLIVFGLALLSEPAAVMTLGTMLVLIVWLYLRGSDL
jgi:hypothetical protein